MKSAILLGTTSALAVLAVGLGGGSAEASTTALEPQSRQLVSGKSYYVSTDRDGSQSYLAVRRHGKKVSYASLSPEGQLMCFSGRIRHGQLTGAYATEHSHGTITQPVRTPRGRVVFLRTGEMGIKYRQVYHRMSQYS